MAQLYDQLSEAVYQASYRVTEDELAAELITVGIFIQVWDRPGELTGVAAPADSKVLGRRLEALAHRRAEAWCADQDRVHLAEIPPRRPR
ncbi:hypothetical protein JOF53_008164 [Crossiella equi]|uniref:Uncharacterized protein n=1 Tax=Crossiella equi TaxID=130796 RepID=A0ABS5ASC0_9PSEU|nr:hypothetical protein [Crossiella equi]MBP2479292.1 hypothetical protein [Crossiella equi]